MFTLVTRPSGPRSARRTGPAAIALSLAGALVLPAAATAAEPKVVKSTITTVTVYQSNALVTREVVVPEGVGSMELVITPLPGQTIESSLYSEGTDGIRVLSTRFRTRVVREDVREEVRKLEAEMKALALESDRLKSEVTTLTANLQTVAKLEGFTAATLTSLTEKGRLDSESAIALIKYVTGERAEKNKALLDLQTKQKANLEQAAFLKRQYELIGTRGGKTEHDAVIALDKRNNAEGKLRLNYLVQSASWRPAYKLRAGADKDPVTLEYLAAIIQNSGEDWSAAQITLSTAQPMLNSAPPDFAALEVNVLRTGTPTDLAAAVPQINPGFQERARDNRRQAQGYLNTGNFKDGNKVLNDTAAEQQAIELFQVAGQKGEDPEVCADSEGPSVSYRIAGKLDIPSRNDEQVVEITRLTLQPDFYYKAVPVLTRHIYRLTDLVNKSDTVLLAGEATMYIGTDFVGRGRLGVVAVGEKFTVGFGVEPQLQVVRRLVSKDRAIQGGNQVLKYVYQDRIISYKNTPVRLQLWERLPTADAQSLAVTLTDVKPALSTDAAYVREERPKNLLRWDLTIEPNTIGEKAVTVDYSYKMELDRLARIGGVTTK